jgi:hypothetical protein
MRALSLAVGLAACADIPDEPFDDGGALSTFIDGDTGATFVNGPNYELEFGLGGNDSFPMPRAFRTTIDNSDTLDDNVPGCAFEAGIGLALFPGIDISALPGRLGAGGMAMQSSLDQVDGMAGPGVVQFEVGYTALYPAGVGQGMQTFTGRSTFTFFATGRIVRHDEFTPFTGASPLAIPTVTEQEPFGCESGGVGGFFLTSYWAFDNGNNSNVVDPDGNDAGDGLPAACTFYPNSDTLVAVAWPQPGANEGTRVEPAGNSSGHVFDFVAQNASSVPPGPYAVTSAIKVATASDLTAENCDDVIAELADGNLMIDGQLFPSDENGIYHALDNVPHDGPIVITAPQGKLPPGVAVLLNLGDATHAEVTKEPSGGSDPLAFVQRGPGGLALFVFRDALLANETITIEPF